LSLTAVTGVLHPGDEMCPLRVLPSLVMFMSKVTNSVSS